MHQYLMAVTGGVLIGCSVTGYLYVNGRIAGMSGLIAQLITQQQAAKAPAIWFIAGLLVFSALYGLFLQPDIQLGSSPFTLMIAGLLVGFGARLGSGCTSGHGICGISRLSVRSIAATITFMLSGFVMVYLMRHGVGASL